MVCQRIVARTSKALATAQEGTHRRARYAAQVISISLRASKMGIARRTAVLLLLAGLLIAVLGVEAPGAKIQDGVDLSAAPLTKKDSAASKGSSEKQRLLEKLKKKGINLSGATDMDLETLRLLASAAGTVGGKFRTPGGVPPADEL
uniref:Uncharacterized protein n=1 Tax=Haptolina brevifila TaxID=156173 RepID=A0A7S2D139_9EUKA